MSRWVAFRQRYVDPPVATVLGAALAPVMALISVVIRVVDGSPALVHLDRVGRHGTVFSMVKFRTMNQAVGADRASGPGLTAAGDDRITRVGGFLRRYRVDELPQLWNVVRRDMALIGPRPETPEFFDADDPRWHAVIAATPGILGPTQIYASSWEADLPSGPEGARRYRDELLPAKLSMDAWYVREATPLVDCRTVIALVQRLVLRRKATALDRFVPTPTSRPLNWPERPPA